MPATPISTPMTGPVPSRNVNRRKKRIAKMIDETALIPSQSATRRSPGLPAIASRFSVVAANDADDIRETPPEKRLTSGLRVRSRNGCWSSISSRFLACIVPSWVRRAWTGATDDPPASPRAMRRIANAAAAAMTIGRTVPIALNLDVHDLADEHEADEHHRGPDAHQDDARRDSGDADCRVEHRRHEVGGDQEQDDRQADRQECHDVPRDPLLGGERADLPLDADPLADRIGDRVEDLRQVATHLVLDGDCRCHEVQVLGLDPADHVLQRLLEWEAQVDLADHPLELCRDRRARLTDNQLDRLQERRSRAERVGKQRDRVRELLVERVEPAALAPLDIEARQEEADDRADQEGDRVLERREEEPEDEHENGDPDDRADPYQEVLADLELEVRAGELAGDVRPEVALLDHPVERRDRGRLREHVADRALPG